MNARLASLPFALLLAAAAPAMAQHEHAAPAAHVDALSGATRARFQADAPLSREMAAIRAAFAARIAAIHAGRLDAAGYAALGAEVETRIATMIRECRLPADADAALHAYIGRMLAAAGRMKRADLDATAHRDAALEAISAYNDYGGRFADPAWKALTP
uniref:DnrO protein n=1 Tax=Mizugakiibacter sediminis TaxID=1475481 RepID=A0A0U1PAS7_9GAMM